MKRAILSTALAGMALAATACDESPEGGTSDGRQQAQQEQMLQEGTAQVGMPSIKNFRERKILKDILELRDQQGLLTYTYVFDAYIAKFVYVGETVGYPLPYSTQFTNPQKIAEKNTYQSGSYAILPQADPNGLFSPASAEGTWVLMKDPSGKDVKPVYMEERVESFPFKLPPAMVMGENH